LYLLGGRRTSTRPGSDRKEFIYVDRYHRWLLHAAIIILIVFQNACWRTLRIHRWIQLSPKKMTAASQW